MTENSMFSITKIIFCIVSEPFISDYIEPDPYNSLRVPGGLHLHGYVFTTRLTIFPFFSVNPIE